MTFDILIKNGTVVDGSGKKPAFKSDVGIIEDKIFSVSNLSSSKGRKEIDAQGLIVCPGFIDVQNHSDSYGSLLRDNHLESLIRQGITTILIGQCGSSLAPLLKGSLASIQKWSAIEGFNVSWKSVAQFFDTVAKSKASVNVTTLVGHATLRRDFTGDQSRVLNQKENEQLELLLRRSLKEGAQGLSLGLAYAHERLTQEEEIQRLLKIIQKENKVVSFHLRHEGSRIFASLNEVISLLHHFPVKAKISHLKLIGEKSMATAEKVLRILENASQEGLPLYFDIYPYLASAVVLYLLLPEWATATGRAELIKSITTPARRQDIIRYLKEQQYPYGKITIATTSLSQNLIGKSLAQLARDQNLSPEETILNLIVASRDQTVVFWHGLDEGVMETLLRHPLAMIATDGSGYSLRERLNNIVPHPRSFGTTAKILGRYVREKRILSLEEAIFKMSGLPAQWLDLDQRGKIVKGNYADLVIFDPHTIQDLSSYDNPFKHPNGIEYVLVNGHLAVERGEYTNSLSGKILKK